MKMYFGPKHVLFCVLYFPYNDEDASLNRDIIHFHGDILLDISLKSAGSQTKTEKDMFQLSYNIANFTHQCLILKKREDICCVVCEVCLLPVVSRDNNQIPHNIFVKWSYILTFEMNLPSLVKQLWS